MGTGATPSATSTTTAEHRYDAGESAFHTRITLRRGEATQAAVIRHAVYTVGETRRLVEAAGFATQALYGATSETPYALGDPRLIAVFERRP